ncbi:glycosyltransferase family 87 protein [Dactylosporangium sp. CA-092794]|uniref:glycosyltransferase family 87 protein n=1 Tax=Dactylosporangium sp. CA-092794 TaxID=3239929 RepID=UPI003D8C6075
MTRVIGTGNDRGHSGRVGVALGVAVVAFVVGYVQKLPCDLAGWPSDRQVEYTRYCYSDIPLLFRERGLIAGIFPYAPQAWQHPLEYPVLTGDLMDLTARLTRALAPGGGDTQLVRLYFGVNVLVLLGLALATVAGVRTLLRRAGDSGTAALLVAGAPVLVLTATINWDLLAVAAGVLALLVWDRDRPMLAGVLLGLGGAAKLFPLFILGPLLLICWRQRRMRAFGSAVAGAAMSWAIVNAPVALRYPDGWLEFYRFNTLRSGEVGSLWYALSRMGYDVPALNVVAPLSLLLLWAGIALLAWRAPRPPTPAQLTFLVIAAFLLTNKVYSPQYVLWLLPFAVLARAGRPLPRVLPAWALWQAAEVWYWVMVWRHLADGHYLLGADGVLYVAATFARLATTGYLAVRVLHEMAVDSPGHSRGDTHPPTPAPGAKHTDLKGLPRSNGPSLATLDTDASAAGPLASRNERSADNFT